jgi:preprotein translocase subunit SecG
VIRRIKSIGIPVVLVVLIAIVLLTRHSGPNMASIGATSFSSSRLLKKLVAKRFVS